MVQPGILKIGKEYYIKIENVLVQLSSVESYERAIAYLFCDYWVLDLKYPELLKFFFVFLETLFGFQESSLSTKSSVVKLFVSKLALFKDRS